MMCDCSEAVEKRSTGVCVGVCVRERELRFFICKISIFWKLLISYIHVRQKQTRASVSIRSDPHLEQKNLKLGCVSNEVCRPSRRKKEREKSFWCTHLYLLFIVHDFAVCQFSGHSPLHAGPVVSAHVICVFPSFHISFNYTRTFSFFFLSCSSPSLHPSLLLSSSLPLSISLSPSLLEAFGPCCAWPYTNWRCNLIFIQEMWLIKKDIVGEWGGGGENVLYRCDFTPCHKEYQEERTHF